MRATCAYSGVFCERRGNGYNPEHGVLATMRFDSEAKRKHSGLASKSRVRIETDLDSGGYDQQGMLAVSTCYHNKQWQGSLSNAWRVCHCDAAIDETIAPAETRCVLGEGHETGAWLEADVGVKKGSPPSLIRLSAIWCPTSS